jgi:beta-glucosidase
MFHALRRRPNTVARLPRSVRCLISTGGVTALTVLAALGATTSPAAAASTAQCPWADSSQPIATRVTQLLQHMTLSDEITLVEGHGTSEPYVFYTPAIPNLCIPAIGEEDGPAGVADQLTGVTQLPAGVALAATFDQKLATQYGQVIGSEEAGKGAAVNLGPTVNIDRDPRWGRSFETLAEDPLLSGTMGSSEIEGVQSQGVMSQVKHYAAYNQETNRNSDQDDVIADARTLHEIYEPSFEDAVKDADVASVMCSYSSINGPYACENPTLETGVLREEWDFQGFVTSDYGAIHDLSAATAGTDQEQPFSDYFGATLQTAVTNGTISRGVVNTMVARVLTEMFRFNLIANPPTGSTTATVTTPAHVAVGTDVADKSATLLKNNGALLPLAARHGGKVAVIGPSASPAPTDGGGGSAYVIPSQTVTPLQGLEAAAGHGTHLSYSQGLPTDGSLPAIPASALSPAYAPTPFGASYSGTLTAPETGTYVLAITNTCACYTPTYLSLNGQQLIDNPGTPPQSVYSTSVPLTAGQTYSLQISGASSALTWGTPSALAPGIAQAVAAAKQASTAVVVVSDDTESEATDRLSLNLPSAQNELVSAVAAANPHTVVVVDAGAPVLMPWLSQVGAVVDAWYPGETDGTSLARVLFGQVDPGGHLPVTFPTSLSQVPASTTAQFPGVGGKVQYSEGLDVGYRWYDAQNLTPLFPFGYGLSYTKFAFSGLRVVSGGQGAVGDVRVSAVVRNVGSKGGSDVAQLYLGDPTAAGEPPRQLAGYQRVSLAPGASERVQFTVTPRDESWWSDDAGGWSQSPGAYRVFVGDSSALSNLPLRGGFVLPTTPGARQVSVQAPSTTAPGAGFAVTAQLSAGGNQTLQRVALALQLPEGWTAQPLGPTTFQNVSPGTAPVARFTVTPPADSPNLNGVVHATATLGPDASREAGVTVTVS